MVIKQCECCGEKFPASRRSVKYCSDTCRKRQAAERNKSSYNDRQEKKSEKKPDRIVEINRLAREAGLSYGQYVAREYLKNKRRFF